MSDDVARRHLIVSVEAARFGDALALVSTLDALPADRRLRIEALCRLGQRLLRLDLTDVTLADEPELSDALEPDLAEVARSLSFPSSARSPHRGALADLGPVIELVLEALKVRWSRAELLHVLAILHLIGEYLGHLAWTDHLGHAADPRALKGQLGGRGSLWGDLDATDCGHHRSHRRLAEQVDDGDPLVDDEQWRRFLRGRYSQIGELLLTCGTRTGARVWGRSPSDCRAECAVWQGASDSSGGDMQRRVAIAQWYRRSPLVKQRHASPIGHFFGVPEPSEVNDAMNELVARLGRSGLLGVEATDLVGQTAEICGAVAGRTMRPARHLDEVAGRIKELLEGSS